jgi:23S rRNA U2552 (ribose-2'-O)-methylase RlmE/FtsJ
MTKRTYKEIKEMVEAHTVPVLMIDLYGDTLNSKDEDLNRQWKACYKAMKKLTDTLRRCCL